MKLILATKNKHKVDEFSRILLPLGIEIISQSDININVQVLEDADSFQGNARKKARAIYNQCKIPTIADDSGLEVYALDNAPGIYSARYGSPECKTDKDRYEKLLYELKDVPKEDRGAQFVCAICLVMSESEEYNIKGICKGEIGFKPHGENGFGYDPVFMIGEKSFAQLDDQKKDEISHRGVALENLKEVLINIKNKGENL